MDVNNLHVNALNAWRREHGSSRTPATAELLAPSLAWLAAGILANIFFNWLWMFGHWGFPSMGLAGAGWATLVSRILMLVGLWVTPGRGEVRWADGLQLAVVQNA